MNTLLPDDPRLTAYALGELDGDEHAAVEAALIRNPALQSIVEEIRATAAQLESALAMEPTPAVESASEPAGVNGHAAPVSARSENCAAILPGSDPNKLDGGSYAIPAAAATKLLRFPQFYFVIGGLAAACFAVLVALHRDDFDLREQARAETLRVAMERRAAEARFDANDRTVVVQLPLIDPVEETSGAPARDVEAAPTSTTVAADNLSLLQQARQLQQSRLADATSTMPAVSPILPRSPRSTFMNGTGAAERAVVDANAEPQAPVSTPASTVTSRASLLATNTPGPIASSRSSADINVADSLSPAKARLAANAGGTGALDYTPGTRSTDARFAPGGGVDLYPGPHRSVAAEPKAANSASSSTLAEPDTVTLSAFTVSADVDKGYKASSTVSGSRIGGSFLSGSAFRVYDRQERQRFPSRPSVIHNTEAYAHLRDNDFLRAAQNPLSTFSIDVDTASYANIRRMIAQRTLPPPDAVRIEELVNYFPYRYPAPAVESGRERSLMEKLRGEENVPPFAASLEIAEAPWAPLHRLVRIGLKGREMPASERAAANLVFLLDVSGSMDTPNKLPLVKESLRLLVGKLRSDDRVAIVTYAGNSGLALASTPVSRSREILDALESLAPGGSTNGAMGIQLAYDIAKANFAPDGINRVILCTDGDFNVGTTSEGELVRLIEEKAASNVFLTVLGCGMGNYKDSMLEKLADKGNGTYGYIDTRREAEKLLVDQVNGTLVTIAKDVKIQVEFNPAKVASYRLIGYENRVLKKEDFNNDKVDAGEIGAGHTVTALYEIVPVGVESPAVADQTSVDDLKYSANAANAAVGSRRALPVSKSDPTSEELLTVKVRYKKPDGLVSRKIEFPLTDSGAMFANASADFRFAAAVAQFGMILRKSEHKGDASIGDVIAWAASAASSPANDPGGYRGEFIDLARQTQQLLKGE